MKNKGKNNYIWQTHPMGVAFPLRSLRSLYIIRIKAGNRKP